MFCSVVFFLEVNPISVICSCAQSFVSLCLFVFSQFVSPVCELVHNVQKLQCLTITQLWWLKALTERENKKSVREGSCVCTCISLLNLYAGSACFILCLFILVVLSPERLFGFSCRTPTLLSFFYVGHCCLVDTWAKKEGELLLFLEEQGQDSKAWQSDAVE